MSLSGSQLGRLAVLAAMALAVPRVVMAQDTTTYQNHLYDKFQVSLAFTAVLNNSDVRVDGSGGNVGDNINFKEILGVSGTSVQPALGLAWKPGRRTELDLGYQFINQSGERTLTDNLVIGNDTVAADFDAKTKLGSSQLDFQFKYSILAKEKYNVGVAVGLGAIFFSMNFDATANGCVGAACDSTAVSVSRKFTGPTAALGAFGQWRLGNRWYVGGNARGIGARVDRFNFSVFEADATARYYLSNRWGLGLGWYYTNVSIDIGAKSDASAAASDLIGKIDYNYTSLRLGVVAAF